LLPRRLRASSQAEGIIITRARCAAACDDESALQEIVDGMRQVIPTLEFTTDCFKVKDVSTEVLELVRSFSPRAT
jgi:hypothetical protein